MADQALLSDRHRAAKVDTTAASWNFPQAFKRSGLVNPACAKSRAESAASSPT